MKLAESIRSFLRRNSCSKLVKYDAYRIVIRGPGATVPPVQVKIDEIRLNREVLRAASGAATALDDLQYQLCLRWRGMSKDDPLKPKTMELLINALLWITAVRVAIASFAEDPAAQAENLRKVTEDATTKLLNARVVTPAESPEATQYGTIKPTLGLNLDVVPIRLPADMSQLGIPWGAINVSGVVSSVLGVPRPELKSLVLTLSSE